MYLLHHCKPDPIAEGNQTARVSLRPAAVSPKPPPPPPRLPSNPGRLAQQLAAMAGTVQPTCLQRPLARQAVAPPSGSSSVPRHPAAGPRRPAVAASAASSSSSVGSAAAQPSAARQAAPAPASPAARQRAVAAAAAAAHPSPAFSSASDRDLDLPAPGFSSIPEALTAMAAGELVVVLDDEDRENEGDLICAADRVTPAAMAFMVRHTSGVVCVGMTGADLDRLRIPLMVSSAENEEAMYTAFTVTVDLRHGTSTGISAADRAATLRALADPDAQPADFKRPGHIFPLRAREVRQWGRCGLGLAVGVAGWVCDAFGRGCCSQHVQLVGSRRYMLRLVLLPVTTQLLSLLLLAHLARRAVCCGGRATPRRQWTCAAWLAAHPRACSARL